MNKAIFVDRDGVINSDEGLYYIYKISDFKLNPDIIENLKC
jgi:D-glycero-D-manno-heptose 1,7-bisphosphate phosphatase